MFHVFYDLLDIILNIYNTEWEPLLNSNSSFHVGAIILSYSVFVLLSYISPVVINRQVLKSNMLIRAS